MSKSHCYIVGAPNQASSSAPDFDSFGNHPNINHGSLVNSPRARWPFRRRHLIGLRPWLTWKAIVNASPKNRFCALLHSTTIRCDASVPTGPASIRKFCSQAMPTLHPAFVERISTGLPTAKIASSSGDQSVSPGRHPINQSRFVQDPRSDR